MNLPASWLLQLAAGLPPAMVLLLAVRLLLFGWIAVLLATTGS